MSEKRRRRRRRVEHEADPHSGSGEPRSDDGGLLRADGAHAERRPQDRR